MTQPYVILFVLLSVLGALFARPQSAYAGPLPPLAVEMRAHWYAVGLVNRAGFRDKSACTGTLIAPDLVLTAAHCVDPVSGLRPIWHFVAGWDRGNFAAHRKSKNILIHPGYGGGDGPHRLKHDVAVIQLSAPIEKADVTPLTVQRSLEAHPARLAVLGYHQKRPHVINGRFDCAGQPQSNAQRLLLDCEVIAGNSGGPVLMAQDDGWAVIAVISARLNADPPHSIAVPIDDWVLSQWRAAIARHRDP